MKEGGNMHPLAMAFRQGLPAACQGASVNCAVWGFHADLGLIVQVRSLEPAHFAPDYAGGMAGPALSPAGLQLWERLADLGRQVAGPKRTAALIVHPALLAKRQPALLQKAA